MHTGQVRTRVGFLRALATTTINSAFNADNELCWTSTSTGTCASPPSGALTYGYDANGNLTTAPNTTTYGYNTLNQMTTHTAPGISDTYTYADTGQNLRTSAEGLNFANSILGLSIDDAYTGGRDYTRDPQGNLIGERNTTNGNHYYLTDALGSIIQIIDNTGTVVKTYGYDPYGNLTTNTGTFGTNNKYTGAYRDDDTQLTHLGQRYNDTTNGRFTQQDSNTSPIANPQTVNRYPYAADNPTNYTDPTGECSGIGGCIGSFFSAAAGVVSSNACALVGGGASGDVIYAGGNAIYTTATTAGVTAAEVTAATVAAVPLAAVGIAGLVLAATQC